VLIRSVDLETTGTGEDAEIIEIGHCDVIITEGRNGKPFVSVGGYASTLCKINGDAIPPESSAVHHICMSDIADAECFGVEIWKKYYLADMAPRIYAAHNAEFERKYLYGHEDWICTYKCAMRAWPDAPAHNLQTLRYWLADNEGCIRGEWVDAALALPAHRAGPDAYVGGHILRALLLEHDAATLMQWTIEPTAYPRIPIGKHRGQAWHEAPADYLSWMTRADLESDIRACARAELNRRSAGAGK